MVSADAASRACHRKRRRRWTTIRRCGRCSPGSLNPRLNLTAQASSSTYCCELHRAPAGLGRIGAAEAAWTRLSAGISPSSERSSVRLPDRRSRRRVRHQRDHPARRLRKGALHLLRTAIAFAGSSVPFSFASQASCFLSSLRSPSVMFATRCRRPGRSARRASPRVASLSPLAMVRR